MVLYRIQVSIGAERIVMIVKGDTVGTECPDQAYRMWGNPMWSPQEHDIWLNLGSPCE